MAAKLGIDLQALQLLNPGVSHRGGVLGDNEVALLLNRSQTLAAQGLNGTGSETAAQEDALDRRFQADTQIVASMLKALHISAEQDLSGCHETALAPGQSLSLSATDHVVVGTNGAGETIVLSAPAGVLMQNSLINGRGEVSHDAGIASITSTAQGFSITDRAGRIRQVADAGDKGLVKAPVPSLTTVGWRHDDDANLVSMPISEATYKRQFPIDAMDYQSFYESDIDWAAPQPELVEGSHPTVALVVDRP